MPTEDAYSSGHLVLSNLGFANVLLLRPLTLNYTFHHLLLIWLLTKYESFPWFDSTNSWPFTWFDFLLNFTLLNIGFHGASAKGVACRQGTLTPPDTWSCLTLGLASVLMLRPISSELVLFPDFWVSNILRYFCFAYICIIWIFVDYCSTKSLNLKFIFNMKDGCGMTTTQRQDGHVTMAGLSIASSFDCMISMDYCHLNSCCQEHMYRCI